MQPIPLTRFLIEARRDKSRITLGNRLPFVPGTRDELERMTCCLPADLAA